MEGKIRGSAAGAADFYRERRARLLDDGMDLLLLALFGWGMSLTAFGMMGLPAGRLGLGAMVLGLSALLIASTRRWWIFPAALGLGAGALVVWQGLRMGWQELGPWWSGLAGWAREGMPASAAYAADGAAIIELVLLLPLVLVLFFILRRFFSLAALGALSAATVFLEYYFLGDAGLALVLGLVLAGMVIALPRAVLIPANRALAAGEKIPRAAMQLTAVPVAALCIALAMWFAPAADGDWFSRGAANLVTDISNAAEFYLGIEPDPNIYSISRSGWNPLGTRLGGDVQPGNGQVLAVSANVQTLLKGQVYDTYTGTGWTDGDNPGRFRLESLLWRGRRDNVFGHDLPLGGERAENIYGRITNAGALSVHCYVGEVNTIFSAGAVTDVTFTGGAAPNVFFNLQSETYMSAPTYNLYRVDTTVWYTGHPFFDELMQELEGYASTKNDRQFRAARRGYLQLPDSLPDEIRQLAAEITAGGGSAYAKALQVKAYLLAHTSYTLTPGTPPADADFVSWFLQTGEGYCTYYATAMTVLCRAAGIPARYVTGYGLLSDGTEGHFVATDATAHAWTEVYLSGIGWVPVDCVGGSLFAVEHTPLTEEQIQESTRAPMVTQDSFERPEDPEPGALPGELPEQPALPATSDIWVLWTALGILAGIALAIWLWFVWLRRLFRKYSYRRVARRGGTPEEQAEYLYHAILRQLRFYTLEVAGGNTLYTFAERADRRVQVPGLPVSMRDVAEVMVKIRFAFRPVDAGEVRRMCEYFAGVEENMLFYYGKGAYFFRRVVFGRPKW